MWNQRRFNETLWNASLPSAPAFISVTPTNGIYNNIGFVNSGFPDANFLRRTDPQGRMITLSKTINPNSAFLDFQVASGVQYRYGGVASYEGQETPVGNQVTATLNLSSVVIHRVARGSYTNNADTDNLLAFELFNLEGQRQIATREGNVMRMAALEKPVIKTAPQVARVIECPILIRNQDRTTVMPALEEMLWSSDLWCFRDPLGTVMFVTFPSQEMRIGINIEMTLVMWESAYDENVE
jgi:hypothetical protein